MGESGVGGPLLALLPVQCTVLFFFFVILGRFRRFSRALEQTAQPPRPLVDSEGGILFVYLRPTG